MGNAGARQHSPQVPRELPEVWAAKQDVIISHDGTSIDLNGGGKIWWRPKHLAVYELKKVTDTFVVSLLHDKVTSINVNLCKSLTDESIMAIAKGCPQLKELNVFGITNLTDDSITAIAKGCPGLKTLDASHCSFITNESIKLIAKSCPELKELHVRSCSSLTDESIKAIAKGCPELKELNVNSIKNLTDEAIEAIAKGCPSLRRLDACGCDLTTLPDDIGDLLPQLHWLDISDNSLTTLPPSIVKLENLQNPHVTNNPLQSPPYEIAKAGMAAILRYFEELKKGSSVSKLLKVVLVGDGEAGKTTLRNALAGRPKPRQEARTIHLDIEKITLTADLDINVYDCGGQEEYLATQLPYLTGLALYMIVVEAQCATDEYADAVGDDKLHRFLAVLQNRVPGAVVLPIVTKIDTVEDPESRRRWLERKIQKWLLDTRNTVCGSLPKSSANSPQPSAMPALDADADDVRHSGNCDTHQFIPLCVQSPALAVSVADTEVVGDVRDSVKAIRNRIIALTKHNPPVLRGVGQQIPATYVAVLKLFGAIAEYGDNDVALEALRDDTAHALGETSKLSPDGTYRPKDELENIWNTYRNEPNRSVTNRIFDDATHLWEAQGLIFVDAGLVLLQPDFMTTIVKPLVDHRHDDEKDYKHFEDVAAQFLKSTPSSDNCSYNELIGALDIFRASGEFECFEKSLFLSFLWRDTGLDKSHYGQVLKMLVTSGVILKVERDFGEGRTVVVVPFRLPRNADGTKLKKFWPASLPLKERELKLRFEPVSGFPTGLAERFVTDVHGLGTSLYSWKTGVVVTASAGYSALAERKENELHFTVRFELYSNENTDAAWKALSAAKQILATHRENRFPGLFYVERFICEECCREGRQRASTGIFDAKRRRSVFRACGHRFDLDSNRQCDVPAVAYNFHAPVSNAQCPAVVQGSATYHSNSPGVL